MWNELEMWLYSYIYQIDTLHTSDRKYTLQSIINLYIYTFCIVQVMCVKHTNEVIVKNSKSP